LVEFTVLTYIGGSAIALFVGFLTGIFGVGGGFLMTPALMVLLDLPGNVTVGTSLATIVANSSYGMLKRRGSGTIDVKLALTIACGSIIGVLAGLAIMELLKKAPPLVILGKEQATIQYILLCLYMPLLVSIALVVILDLRKNSAGKAAKRIGLFSKVKLPPFAHFSSLDNQKLSLAPIVGLGLVVGFLTALMGVGGGVIILPGLIYLVGQRPVKAAGTSLLLVWLSSAISVAGHISAGNINWPLLGCMLVGGIIGTNFGTIVGLKLPGSKIRFYFAFVVILAIAMVAFKLANITFR